MRLSIGMASLGPAIYRDRNDWWVGYYRGPDHHYVCPLPTIVIRWRRKREVKPVDKACHRWPGCGCQTGCFFGPGAT